MSVVRTRAARGDKFNAVMAKIAGRLPFGLATVVPPSFLGFAVINSFTFGVDLALLFLLHGVLDLVLPLSITIAYALAFPGRTIYLLVFPVSSTLLIAITVIMNVLYVITAQMPTASTRTSTTATGARRRS